MRLTLLFTASAPVLGAPPASPTGLFDQPVEESPVRLLSNVLLHEPTSSDTRTSAVRQLLRLEDPTALEVLDTALRSDDPVTVQATLQGLSETAVPPPSLLDAVIAALESTPPEGRRDLLGTVLSKYEKPALDRVAALAEDRAAPHQARLAAIEALESFLQQESGDRLIALADPHLGESPEIREAALRSLQSFAPADLVDYEALRQWWDRMGVKSPEQWSRDMVRRYRRQKTQLEQSNTELSERYIGALHELFRTLPETNDQLERLPPLLNDTMPEVRRFAMERIGLLIRDSVLIPEPVRVELRVRLGDGDGEVRLRAVRLLNELDEPDVAGLVVERIDAETNRTVLEGLFPLIDEHRRIDALDPALRWLDDPQVGPPAADAVWALLRHPVDADGNPVAPPLDRVRRRGRDALMHRDDRTSNPSLARLLAFVADEPDLPEVEAALDAPEPAVRSAVAEGLFARGRTEPVLERVADEAIYRSVLASLAGGPADLAQFQQLVDMRRAQNGNNERWVQAVRTLGKRLAPADLLGADDMLARTEDAGSPLRSNLLIRGAMAEPSELTTAMRGQLLVRLAPMMIEQGDALRAFELIEEVVEHAEHPDLPYLTFRCAVFAGKYDVAATTHDEPVDWVQVLIELVPRDREAAVRVRDIILERYRDELGGEVGEHFESASSKLPPPIAGTQGSADAGNSPTVP